TTDHAQDALGELVYVELPDPGRKVDRGEACIVVESTKAASDVYAPVAGEVLAVNDALGADPQTVNSDPIGQGWLIRLRPTDAAAFDGLMSAADYSASTDA